MKLNLYLTNKVMFFLIACLAFSTQLSIKKRSYTKESLIKDLKIYRPIKEILADSDKMDETAKGMIKYIYSNIDKVISELSNEISLAPEKIKNNKDLKNFIKKFAEEDKKGKAFDKDIHEMLSQKQKDLDSLKDDEKDASTMFLNELKELLQKIKHEISNLKPLISKIKVDEKSTIRLNEHEARIEKDYISNQISAIILGEEKYSTIMDTIKDKCVSGICALIHSVKSNFTKKFRLSTSSKNKKVLGVIIAFLSVIIIGAMIYQIAKILAEMLITVAVAPLFGIAYFFSKV